MQPAKAKLIKTNFPPAGYLRARALLTTAIALPLALGLVISPKEALAVTLPTGGNVAGGTATISTNGAGTVETINQSTQRVVINWNDFNVGQGGTVQFNQPNSGALALNRVTGSASASQINGIINANGGVWVINPNGVMIGATGQVNANSFVASTGHVKTSDFMSGTSQIQVSNMNPDADVINNGHIAVADAGLVALLGSGAVANNGTINAKFGRVELAGGKTATVDFNGDGLISIAVADPLSHNNKLSNNGTINAEGGIVQMELKTAQGTLNDALNMSGIEIAGDIHAQGGKIILTSVGSSNIKIGGSNPKPNSGKLDASNSNGMGGEIDINGNHVTLDNSAFLDADGSAGGGIININATTYPTGLFSNPSVGDINIAPFAIVTVNTNNLGQGGKVTLISDGTAEVGGTFLAHGFPDSVLGPDGTLQSVNTSAVSISADVNLEYNASADLRPFGPGAAGTLTLSTPNLTVGPAGNPSTTLTGAKLAQQLDLFGNVKLDSHNVTFDESVHSNSVNTLTAILKDGFKFILGIPVAEAGQLVFNQDVSLKNLVLQSPSADGMDVSGSALPNLHVTNLTLDAPANFAQTPIFEPNTVTVSGALSNEGLIQQGMDLVASGGTVFLDSNKLTSGQDATVNNAFTLTGLNPYNFDNLTINNPGLIVTYHAGLPSVTANTVNLNADNPFTHLLQTTYDMASGATGVFIPTLNLGLTQYLDDLNYYNSHVAVLAQNLAILNSLTLSSSSAFIGNVLANDVYDIAASGQQGYDLVADGGRVHYAQPNYGTLFVYNPNITLIGAPGGSYFNDIHFVTASDTFNNITTDWVGVHVVDATAQGTDLVNLHGQVHYYFDDALNTALDLNRDINLYGNGPSGRTTFGTLTLNTLFGSLTNIFGNVVNDNQGPAQRGYNVTAENGILNLAQSGYAEILDANTAGVTVNGAPGTGTTLNALTMDAINSFNGITTSLINVNVAHMAQKANDMVNSGGIVNFAGLNNSPETLTLNRADITLNGAPLGGTIFDTLNVNALPTLNNIFGNNVNSNTGPAMYSVNATATGGTDNLSRFVYAPEDLTVDRFMTVIGINPVSVFKRVFNNAGATLIRIAELQNPNGPANGLTPVQSNLNNQLPPNITPASLEALLSSLAPAGPDAKDNEGLRLCITKSADAANACIADVLAADGNTAVDYKITSDNLTEPKDTLMNVRNISRDEFQRLLDGGLDI